MTRALALILAAACGAPDYRAWDGDPASCTAVVEGACWRGADQELAQAVTDAALAYWGPLPIAGWLIVMGPTAAEEHCGGHATACAAGAPVRAIFMPEGPCRGAVFIHEAGHILLSDGEHVDPRWAGVPAAMAAYCAGETAP